MEEVLEEIRIQLSAIKEELQKRNTIEEIKIKKIVSIDGTIEKQINELSQTLRNYL